MTTPMVDLVSQLPGPAYTPPRIFDDPQVATYCRETGPELGVIPRAVLREIGRYADPATGIAPPLMVTIAKTLDASTSSVARAIKTCEYAGLVEVTPIQTRNGRTRYSYTLATGLQAGWRPAPKPDRGKVSLADHRLKTMTDLAKRVAELESMLDGAVNEATGEIITPENIVRSEWAYEEEGIVPLSENQEILPSFRSLLSPPAAYDREYVEWALPQFPAWESKWGGGVKVASDYYLTRWPKFLEDLARHKAKADYEPISKGQIRCLTCLEVKPEAESSRGHCARCKHVVSWEKRQKGLVPQA